MNFQLYLIQFHMGGFQDFDLIIADLEHLSLLRNALTIMQNHARQGLIVIGNGQVELVSVVEVVDFENIQRTARIEGEVLVAIAVYIGKTRLIDNFIVNI